METKLSLRDKTVLIGPAHPFVVIGERINPTRRKKLAASLQERDFSLVQAEAHLQARAGASVLDINAGVPDADEPALLRGAAQAVMEVVDLPLCFDSANPEALAAALEVYPGKALINSTTAETKMMDTVLPLARQFGAAVIGVITDDQGVPATPRDRLKVAEKLIKRAGDFGIPPEDIIIDPLALTVSADHHAARLTLDSLRLIQQELGVNMNLGASNVSFGLPDRKIVNAAYLALAISRGLTTAITDPTVPEIQTTLLACDLLMGQDEFSMHWIKAFRAREKAKAAEAAS
ncbi:MAG TPA: dihydropteroate synthase [Anaerolineales bacterium]|nr:dihydropteroate synthase [Anaerolineales bacterium]